MRTGTGQDVRGAGAGRAARDGCSTAPGARSCRTSRPWGAACTPGPAPAAGAGAGTASSTSRTRGMRGRERGGPARGGASRRAWASSARLELFSAGVLRVAGSAVERGGRRRGEDETDGSDDAPNRLKWASGLGLLASSEANATCAPTCTFVCSGGSLTRGLRRLLSPSSVLEPMASTYSILVCP